LQAHVSAGQGCLRGVRHHATRDDGVVGQFIHSAPRYLLADPTFRHGLACPARFDLAFDVVVFHTQLDEVADLLDACPRNRFVLNHVGLPIGVGEYETHRAAVFAEWRLKMHALAQRPNLDVKIGGMGMPIFGFGFENARRPARSDELARAWQPTIDVCVQAFGPQRCMFESNFPMDKQACGYAALWNAFKLCTRGMSTDERAALFYRTACRTYRLPELERLVA
jgi:predicted TIM-barrel fold metal-dependent hydrolase